MHNPVPENPFDDESLKYAIPAENNFDDDAYENVPNAYGPNAYDSIPHDGNIIIPNTESKSNPEQNKTEINYAQKNHELHLKELQLQEREEALRQREINLRENPQNNGQPAPNWPSTCYGLYYHDIGQEIPQEFKLFVRKLYLNWIMTSLCLLYNVLALFIAWFSEGHSAGLGQCFWAGIWCVCGIPGSWRLWYWKHYCNFRDHNTPSTLRFTLGFGLHLIFISFGAVGMESWGMVGVFMITNKTGYMGPFVFGLAACILWILCAAYSFYISNAAKAIFARATLMRELAASGQSFVGVNPSAPQVN